MPAVYRFFVYYVNPIAYYVRGQVAVILHDLHLECIEEDIYRFDAPPGQTCLQYAGQFVTQVGGQLFNSNLSLDCGYCQYQDGDQFAKYLSADYDFRWQNYGIFLGFTVFQLFASYALYWLFRVKSYGLSIDRTLTLLSRSLQ